MDLVPVVLAAVTAMALGLVVIPRYLRTRRALREPIGGDECVACASKNVATFAPECFRCELCGFTWGDGMKEHAALQRQAQLAGLNGDQRRQLAIRELQEAYSCLVAADVSLEHASNQLGFDLVAGGGLGTGDMYSRARNEGMVKAAGEMARAQRHIRNAAEAVEYAIPGADGAIDFRAEVFAFDVFFESSIVDIVGHMQVVKLQRQLAAMRDAVDRAMKSIQSA
jgi:hypothetical protein